MDIIQINVLKSSFWAGEMAQQLRALTSRGHEFKSQQLLGGSQPPIMRHKFKKPLGWSELEKKAKKKKKAIVGREGTETFIFNYFVLFLRVWLFCLYVHLHTTCECDTLRGQKRALDPLKL